MKINYHRELSHLNMCCELEEEKTVRSYPVQMCLRNSLSGLLACSLQSLDGRFYLCWDVTSRQSFQELCSQKEAVDGLFPCVLTALYETMGEMDHYLIPCNYLVPAPEHIYIDPGDGRAFFICDFECEDSFHAGILRLAELCLSLVDHSSQREVRIGYGLYRLAVQDQFSREEFQQLLFQNGEPEGKKEGQEAEQSRVQELKEKKEQFEEVFSSFWEDDEEEESGSPGASVSLYALLLGVAVMGMEIVMFIRNGYFLQPGWLLLGAVLFLLCIAVSLGARLMAGRKRKKDKGIPETGYAPEKRAGTRYVGEGTVVRRYVDKESTGTRYAEAGSVGKRYAEEGAALSGNACERRAGGKEAFWEREQGVPYGASPRRKEVLPPEPSAPDSDWGETRVLSLNGSSEPEPQRYFLEAKGKEERLLVPGQGAILGSWQKVVDIHIDSRVVSRIHARISREGEEWKLRDLHSRNGTWVNGHALAGDEEVSVKNGDELCFADQVYLFKAM